MEELEGVIPVLVTRVGVPEDVLSDDGLVDWILCMMGR